MRYWPFFPIVHGEKKWQPVFVDDVAKAIRESLKTEAAKGATYELAGPAVMTTVELADWLSKILKMENDQYKIPVNDTLLWQVSPVVVF